MFVAAAPHRIAFCAGSRAGALVVPRVLLRPRAVTAPGRAPCGRLSVVAPACAGAHGPSGSNDLPDHGRDESGSLNALRDLIRLSRRGPRLFPRTPAGDAEWAELVASNPAGLAALAAQAQHNPASLLFPHLPGVAKTADWGTTELRDLLLLLLLTEPTKLAVGINVVRTVAKRDRRDHDGRSRADKAAYARHLLFTLKKSTEARLRSEYKYILEGRKGGGGVSGNIVAFQRAKQAQQTFKGGAGGAESPPL